MQDITASVGQQAEQATGMLIGELAAAAGVAATLLGVRLGLWSSLVGLPPATASEVAAQTGLAEPFVREWLRAQAAGGYLDYEPRSGRFRLSSGLAAVLGTEGGGLVGALATQVCTWYADLDVLADGLRSGRGLAWQERAPQNSAAMDVITRAVVCPALVSQWLPAMDGVSDRLAAGGRVADVGCGYGAATRAVAHTFPGAEVWGFDTDEASIARARQADGARARFEVGTAKTFPGGDYDLITYLDTFHDLGDPVGALVHARAALAPGGAVLLVEPGAADRVEDNFTPTGRLFYAASALVCTPNALAQEGHALGALAGEQALRAVAAEAGFRTVTRLSVDAPFNLLLELRP